MMFPAVEKSVTLYPTLHPVSCPAPCFLHRDGWLLPLTPAVW